MQYLTNYPIGAIDNLPDFYLLPPNSIIVLVTNLGAASEINSIKLRPKKDWEGKDFPSISSPFYSPSFSLQDCNLPQNSYNDHFLFKDYGPALFYFNKALAMPEPFHDYLARTSERRPYPISDFLTLLSKLEGNNSAIQKLFSTFHISHPFNWS